MAIVDDLASKNTKTAEDLPHAVFDTLIFKIASRCNLNCSYCYVYNQGDSTWKQRPKLMSDELFMAGLQRLYDHAQSRSLQRVNVGFHGGEPTLIGSRRLDSWCQYTLDRFGTSTQVRFMIQTNGTLLDDSWARLFDKFRFNVGVSIDGTSDNHDKNRVDHRGLGSYQRVISGIEILKRRSIPFTTLCVLPLGVDPIATHRSLISLGPSRVNYLFLIFRMRISLDQNTVWRYTVCRLPDTRVRRMVEQWLAQATVTIFRQIAKIILGGDSDLDTLGMVRCIFCLSSQTARGGARCPASLCPRHGRNRSQCAPQRLEDVISASRLHGQVAMGRVPLPRLARLCGGFDLCRRLFATSVSSAHRI